MTLVGRPGQAVSRGSPGSSEGSRQSGSGSVKIIPGANPNDFPTGEGQPLEGQKVLAGSPPSADEKAMNAMGLQGQPSQEQRNVQMAVNQAAIYQRNAEARARAEGRAVAEQPSLTYTEPSTGRKFAVKNVPGYESGQEIVEKQTESGSVKMQMNSPGLSEQGKTLPLAQPTPMPAVAKSQAEIQREQLRFLGVQLPFQDDNKPSRKDVGGSSWTSTTSTTTGSTTLSSNQDGSLRSPMQDSLNRMWKNLWTSPVGYENSDAAGMGISPSEYSQLNIAGKLAVSSKSRALRGPDVDMAASVNNVADMYQKQQQTQDTQVNSLLRNAVYRSEGVTVMNPAKAGTVMVEGQAVTQPDKLRQLQDEYNKQSSDYLAGVQQWREGRTAQAMNSGVAFDRSGIIPIPKNAYTGELIVQGGVTALFPMFSGMAALKAGQGVLGMMGRGAATATILQTGSFAFREGVMPYVQRGYNLNFVQPMQSREAGLKYKGVAMAGTELALNLGGFIGAEYAAGKFMNRVAGLSNVKIAEGDVVKNEVKLRGRGLSDYLPENINKPTTKYYIIKSEAPIAASSANRLAKTSGEMSFKDYIAMRGNDFLGGERSVSLTRTGLTDDMNRMFGKVWDKTAGRINVLKYGEYSPPKSSAEYLMQSKNYPGLSTSGFKDSIGKAYEDLMGSRPPASVIKPQKLKPEDMNLSNYEVTDYVQSVSLPSRKGAGVSHLESLPSQSSRSTTVLTDKATQKLYSFIGETKSTRLSKNLFLERAKGVSYEGDAFSLRNIISDALKYPSDLKKTGMFDISVLMKEGSAGGRGLERDVLSGFSGKSGSLGKEFTQAFGGFYSGGAVRQNTPAGRIMAGGRSSGGGMQSGMMEGFDFGMAYGNAPAYQNQQASSFFSGFGGMFAEAPASKLASKAAFASMFTGGMGVASRQKVSQFDAMEILSIHPNLFAGDYGNVMDAALGEGVASKVAQGQKNMNFFKGSLKNAGVMNINRMLNDNVNLNPNKNTNKELNKNIYTNDFINNIIDVNKIPFSPNVTPPPFDWDFAIPFTLPNMDLGGSGGAWGKWTKFKGGRKKWKLATPQEVLSATTGFAPEKFIVKINTIDDLMRIPKPRSKGKKKHGKGKGGMMPIDFDKGLEVDEDALDFLEWL